MSVFLLVTLEGSSYAPPACTGIFSDVACPSGFANWIEELARRGIAGGCGGGNYCPNDSVTRGQMAVFLVGTWGFTTAATPAGQKRLFFYTPEMNLMVETEYTASYHPQVFYEHFWLGGQPVAETDTGTSTVHWTMTDHLGTPVLWTDSTATPVWRVEHEPYGKVFKLRSGSASHQPLRLPGQEAEQLGASSETALNGQTKRSYNIFRWYRPNWGRYTQSDPVSLVTVPADYDLWATAGLRLTMLTTPLRQHPYAYSLDEPTLLTDPDGQAATKPWYVSQCVWRQLTTAFREGNNSGLPGRTNGPQDAYRHCVGICLIKKNCGASDAFVGGTLHEVFTTDPFDSRSMDLHNNVVGRSCADTSCKCESCCLGALRSGELTWLPPNRWSNK